MAFQSQTYGNSNNGYYVTNQTPINPNDPTALVSPVEFLLNSTIAGAYYGEITQGISSFTISEKSTATLSTISYLTMDPTRPVVQMGVVDLANPYSEPVIQQWGTVSSIVNGIFKIGSKANINDDSTAYEFANNPAQTIQRQGDLIQTTNLANNRNRFSNINDGGFSFTEINQTASNPSVSVVNLAGQTKVTVSTISFSDFTTSPTQIAKIGTKASAVGSFLIESAADTQIRTSLNNLQTATFNANGTTNLLSTLTVPYISTLNISTTTLTATGSAYPLATTTLTPTQINLQVIDNIRNPKVTLSVASSQGQAIFETVLLKTMIGTDQGGDGFIQTQGDFNLLGDDPNSANTVLGLHMNNLDGSINIVHKMYGPLVSTTTANTSTITANITRVGKDTITNNNSNSVPDYSSGYGNYQGQLVYNTLRNTYANPDAPPTTAVQSLEIVNVSNDPAAGGIQFYTSNNSAPNAPKWMGGFLQNDVGAGQSEFRLASTVTASLPSIVNLTSVNGDAYSPFYPGMIMPYAGPVSLAAPYLALPGWEWCIGSRFSPTDPKYAKLFAAIGFTYGQYGSLFGIPNLKNRTICGSMNGSGTNQNVGICQGVGWKEVMLIPSSTVPNGKVERQCIAVVSINVGQIELAVGQQLRTLDATIDAGTYEIEYIMNYKGGDGPYNIFSQFAQTNCPVIILKTAMATDIGYTGNLNFTGVPLVITNIPGYNAFGATTNNNYTIQDPYAVAPHTHGGTPNTSAGLYIAGGVEGGRANQTSNPAQNLYYNIGGGYPFNGTIPTGMPNIPSAVFMNYIIKL